MLNTFVARTLVLLHVVSNVVSAHLRGRRSAFATAPAGVRAVTFIEYALLAGIAVLVAAIFRSQLSSTFSILLGKFKGCATNFTGNAC